MFGRIARQERDHLARAAEARSQSPRGRGSGYPSLSAMKPVMRNSGRGRADERDRIAASLSGWYNQLHLLFNHLFLVFSVR